MRFDSILIALLAMALVGAFIIKGFDDNLENTPTAFKDSDFNKLVDTYSNTSDFSLKVDESVKINDSASSNDTVVNSLIKTSLAGLNTVKDSVGLYKAMINIFLKKLGIPIEIINFLGLALAITVGFMIVSLFCRPWR